MNIILSNKCLLIILLLFISGAVQNQAEATTCNKPKSPCFLKELPCPSECPTPYPNDPKAKVCHVNCNSPICQAECKTRKPNCGSPGAAYFDPRFIGADGIAFYFHGKSNEHFSLVSNPNLQINAHFIGLRPAGRPRDYTWIQALGILFDSQSFSVEATKAATWDDEVDNLKFSYSGKELVIPEGYPSVWKSNVKQHNFPWEMSNQSLGQDDQYFRRTSNGKNHKDDIYFSSSIGIYQLRENSTCGKIFCIIISARNHLIDHTDTAIKWLKWSQWNAWDMICVVIFRFHEAVKG